MVDGIFAPVTRVAPPFSAPVSAAPIKFGDRVEAVAKRRPWQHEHADTGANVDLREAASLESAALEIGGAPALFVPASSPWNEDSILIYGTRTHAYRHQPNQHPSYAQAAQGRKTVSLRTGHALRLDQEVAPIHAEDGAVVLVRHATTRGGLLDSPAAVAADAADQIRHARITHSERHAQADALKRFKDANLRPTGGDRRTGPGRNALPSAAQTRTAARSVANITKDIITKFFRDQPDQPIATPSDLLAESAVVSAIADLLRSVNVAAWRPSALRTQQALQTQARSFLPQSRGIALTA